MGARFRRHACSFAGAARPPVRDGAATRPSRDRVLLSFRPANSAVVKATRDVHTRTDTFWRFSGVYRLSGVWKRVYKPCSREGDFRIFICVCAHVPGGLGDGGGSHSICVSRVEPCVHTQPEPAHSWIVILVSRATRARAARVPGGGYCVWPNPFFSRCRGDRKRPTSCESRPNSEIPIAPQHKGRLLIHMWVARTYGGTPELERNITCTMHTSLPHTSLPLP